MLRHPSCLLVFCRVCPENVPYKQLKILPIQLIFQCFYVYSVCYMLENLTFLDSVNRALHRLTTQSSIATGTSDLVVDGNPTPVIRICSVTAQEAYPWWQVDLGSEERVAMVVIINRGDCCLECGRSL